MKVARKSPIVEFGSVEDLEKCLNEWQDILFLKHWIIQASLSDRPVYDMGGKELIGQTLMVFESNCASIIIKKPDSIVSNGMVKYCAELNLVHELLHLKYNWLEDNNTYEGKYVNAKEHQLLEQMAKSLIMAKYGIPFSWFFNNVEGEDDE